MQAMPTNRDSGRSDHASGFWWSWASGRQAQPDIRAARITSGVQVRGSGPVRRPIVIEVFQPVEDRPSRGVQPGGSGLGSPIWLRGIQYRVRFGCMGGFAAPKLP
jgi:hypothetical protein